MKSEKNKKRELILKELKENGGELTVDIVCRVISEYYLDNEKHAKTVLQGMVKAKQLKKAKRGVWVIETNKKEKTPQLSLFEDEGEAING